MHLSQSAISRQMQALETEVGCSLFDRSVKSVVVLTAEGELFLRFARSVLSQRTLFRDSLDDFTYKRKGRVRITCPESLAHLVLPRYVRSYSKENPDVDVRVLALNSTQALDMLHRGEVDLSAVLQSKVHPGMETKFWREGRYMVMVPKGHPLTQEKVATLEKLVQYRLILPHKKSGISARHLLDAKCTENNMPLDICLECDAVPLKAEYVRIGFGVCFLMAVKEAQQLYPDELDFIPMDHLFPPNDVVICMRSHELLSEPAKAFLDCLLDS